MLQIQKVLNLLRKIVNGQNSSHDLAYWILLGK